MTVIHLTETKTFLTETKAEAETEIKNLLELSSRRIKKQSIDRKVKKGVEYYKATITLEAISEKDAFEIHFAEE